MHFPVFSLIFCRCSACLPRAKCPGARKHVGAPYVGCSIAGSVHALMRQEHARGGLFSRDAPAAASRKHRYFLKTQLKKRILIDFAWGCAFFLVDTLWFLTPVN